MTRMELQTTTETVAHRVKRALGDIDRSGRWLARQLEETHAWVHRRLSGEVEFAASDLERISKVLGVPVAAFFGEVAA